MTADPDEELVLLRREVQTLRQRVAELQRRTARHRDGDEARDQAGVEVAVSAREELLVEAERIAHVGSWIWDVESNGVFWSDEMFRIMGYDPERDKAGVEAFFARVHPDDQARVREALAQAVDSGVPPQMDIRILLPDGSLRYLIANASMLFDDTGKLRRQVGTMLDLTQERRLNEQMRRTLELLEEAETIAQLGSWTFDTTTQRTTWSPGLYRILGLDPGTPPSADRFISIVHPDEREKITETFRQSLEGSWTKEVEVRFMRPSGEIRQALIRTIPVKDPNGRIVEFRGTILDTTDRTALAEQLARMGRMDAVGRLAGGIAHDFNNLLTVIGANLELWAEASGTEGEIADARRAVRSARSLTDRLLTFGRKAQLTKVVVDPNELVARTVDLVRRVIGDRVRLELDLTPVTPHISVDPTLIEQALINLVINARDAMPRGGTVTLRTRVLATGVGKNLVEIEVADDGPGMEPSVKERIFEPFFTTKGEFGTGLGLPTVLGTVEQHGGHVEVDSEKGKGSRFRLRLPAEPLAVKEPLGQEARQPEIREIGREILVIEDEPLVAAVIARSLERKGHVVILAHLPADAIRLWDEHSDIELVICDVSMGEMRGPELVRILRKSGRKVRVLYVTGYSQEDMGDILGEPMLSKPFSPSELIRAVSNLGLLPPA